VAFIVLLGFVPVLMVVASDENNNDSQRGIVITLKNDFIQMYKSRVAIEATYTVDKAHKHSNPAKKDGDMHVAGRAPEIELATVAEIMNAASQHDAVDRIHAVEGTDETVKITAGAWWATTGVQGVA
jgi:hypothetical protein